MRVVTDDGVPLSGIVVPAVPPATGPPGRRALTFVAADAVVSLGLSMVEGPRCPPPLASSRRDPAPGPAVVRDTRPVRRVHWLLETGVGDRDEYFPLEHFRTPARAAGPTATAEVVPGFGHAESGATAPLVERIGRWASGTIDG